MRKRSRVAGGQATVELALTLPLIALLALALLQVALVARDQVLVVHAAREAAREAAVSGDPATPKSVGLRASSLKLTSLTVDISGRRERGSRITASVSYLAPTEVPLIGKLVPDIPLRSAATMRVEEHAEWSDRNGARNLAGSAS
ncbi:MAG: TadE/TadG family type IV pilus assembly protein [Acidimicrobiia bacterium]